MNPTNSSAVRCWREPVTLPTYAPQAADPNPMFLERRVYQGSSGRVYPLPFIDRIAEHAVPQAWDAVHLENEYLYVMILPQLGGRIHVARDRTNGYDFIYHQPVIKPALVGLAGPWISGGIEFNWPQHHRPSTFMPADVALEHSPDGAVTVWLGEHDPMARMKGMHGVCLRPGRAVLEVKVRAYNRTPHRQTFLWWANVAARVHERYQSFFPPDATFVADHAKRALSAFPLCRGRYYGVDYAARARHGVPARERPEKYVPPGNYPANDLSWYANIPVPTSYMCLGTEENFFGGYDHARGAGFVHVADHRIAPGKKQWTWGNHAFGYAWDRNLTDADAHGEFAPYIELMAGVFTDNQPDFSFLAPGETKTWSQHWYPIRDVGVVQQANLDAAVSLRVADGRAHLGVAVTATQPDAVVTLSRRGRELHRATATLAPGQPHVADVALPRDAHATGLRLAVTDASGRELVAYAPRAQPKRPLPPAATEPPPPRAIASADELYLTGLHLEQYRHATREPAEYWREALRRDPGDARANEALGRWHLQRGEWRDSERHLRAAVARLTSRNPNPEHGSAHYHLGLNLRFQGDAAGAYDAFAKAAWDHAWQAPAWHALAELDGGRRDWPRALEHVDGVLRRDADNLRARDLKVMVLRRLGRETEAETLLRETRALDPLDAWACFLAGETIPGDYQVRLDLAHDLARAGFCAEAIAVLEPATRETGTDGTAPLVHYTLGWLHEANGDARQGRRHFAAGAAANPDYCFPARLEEIAILEHAIAARPRDARAPYYLGNLLYDRRRHREALALWRRAVRLEPGNAVAWRNLGLGCFNVLRQPRAARAAYERAVRANPADARLRYERDQLWKRLGVPAAARLRELERARELVARRDDLTLEYCALLNQAGRHADAQAVLAARRFQPWEGGEGVALGQHVRTQLALGRKALATGDAETARAHFTSALRPPENLGEARHLLANPSDIYFWLGCALEALGDRRGARDQWTIAATTRGDFQQMSVREFSELTYWSVRATEKLGRRAVARRQWRDLLAYARRLARTPAKIDYFATSLPTLLLFADDLDARQRTTAKFLEAQARLGLGQTARARQLLCEVLRRDPSHAAAADLLA